jgi:hypothetical protein
LQPDDKLHRWRAASLAALRIVLVAHALGVLTQAVLAGQFLSGVESPVVFHERTAWLVVGLSVVQVILAILLVRVGGPLWLVIASIFLLIAEALQTATGYGRFLGVHVPLGVFVFAAVVWLASWAFRKQTLGGAESL